RTAPDRNRTIPRSRARSAESARYRGQRTSRPAAVAAAGPGRGAEGLQDRAALARPVAGRSPTALSDPSPTGLRLDSSTASIVSSAGPGAKTPGLAISTGLIGDRPGPYNASF